MTISKAMIIKLRQDYALDWHGIHGASHWARVRQNGLLLVAEINADFDVVEFFHLFTTPAD